IQQSIRQVASEVRHDASKVEETNFILYFSGYGTTLHDGKQTKCIMAYDANPDALADSCIATTDIDAWLDAYPWRNTVVIFDTSYDGIPFKSADNQLVGKTFGSFQADDNSWRYTAGIRPNRLLLVASAANSVALESSQEQHGIFTAGLQK